MNTATEFTKANETYITGDYNGIKVLFHHLDKEAQASAEPAALFNKHGFSASSGNKVTELYYLRGHRKYVSFDKVLIAALENLPTLPDDLYKMLENITFWNFDGENCHTMNCKNDDNYKDFILRVIASDATAFVDAHPHYLTGKGGNHVWIAEKSTGKRVLVIHF